MDSFYQLNKEHAVISQWFANQSAASLKKVQLSLQQQLRESHGVTYQIEAPPPELSLTPWLVLPEEWQVLQQGISQRHRLLAAIIADLYGPQRLLHEGIIPAQHLFSQPAFLSQCAGMLTNPQHWLPLLSYQIVVTANGFAVSKDSSIPTGLGLTLAHRLALRRCIPQLLQQLPIIPLAEFFRSLRSQMQTKPGLAVLVNKGLSDPDYYEQAYLANYLNLPLLRTADLMFSHQKIWLKTINGLQQVSSILRFIDDQQTDNLVFEQATTGIAGLFQSLRLQQVLCHNAPGTAILNKMLLTPYLEQASSLLLQQPLLLPTLRQDEPVTGPTLHLFSLLKANQQVAMLPGGLAASQTGTDKRYQDIWVLSDQTQNESLLQQSTHKLALSRDAGFVSSRVADHLFWLARYNERLNLLLRALRVAIPVMALSQQSGATVQCFLNFCLQANGQPLATEQSQPSLSGVQQTLAQLLLADSPAGVLQLVKNMIYNALSVREYFSEDTWLLLDKIQQLASQWPVHPDFSQPRSLLSLLDELLLLQTAFYGINTETMSRTQAFRFMELGQHLERALQHSCLLQLAFQDSLPDAELMEALLKMTDTLLTYRRRYRSELDAAAILDLLLLDNSTPRSVAFQLSQLQRDTSKLPALNTAARRKLPALGDVLLPLVLEHDAVALCTEPTHQLLPLLAELRLLLRTLSDELSHCYFSHSDQSKVWESR